MNFRIHRRSEPEIGMAPLIDVVFLLLIFFAVSTTFSREAELKIDLPQASVLPEEQRTQTLEVVVDSRGNYFVGGQAVINTQVDTLKRAIRKAAAGRTGQPLVISADAKAPHQAVVTAMDAAGQAGFIHLAITTRRPPDDD